MVRSASQPHLRMAFGACLALGLVGPALGQTAGNPPGDFVAIVRWEMTDADVDLSVIGPGGQTYRHADDVTRGPGQETCTVRNPPRGVYQIRTQLYRAAQPTPVTVETRLGGRVVSTRTAVLQPRRGNTVVDTVRVGRLPILPVTDATPPSAEALAAALGELARKLPPSRLRPGLIVHEARRRIYVNLGAEDGVKPGDEFDIVRPRDMLAAGAVGRLRVTYVQDKLCVCDRVSGIVEAKNLRGDWNQVVMSPDGAKRTLLLAKTPSAEQGVDLSDGALRTALLAALKNTPAFGVVESEPLAPNAPADYELRGLLAPPEAGQGPALCLQLLGRASGKAVGEAKVPYKTSVSLAELGFQAAVSARLADKLDMERIEDVVASKFGTAGPTWIRPAGRPVADGPVFIPRLNLRGDVAWVFPDGRIAVATRGDPSAPTFVTQLIGTWQVVAMAIDPERVAEAAPEVLTASADQYQWLEVQPPLSFAWTLKWPDAKANWAVLTRTGDFAPYSWNLDGKGVGPPSASSGDSTGLASLYAGDHPLSGSCVKAGAQMRIVAFFPKPNGRIGLTSNAILGGPAHRFSSSRSLSELLVPPCEAYGR